EMEGTCRNAFQLAPAHQRFFPPMRDPYFGCAAVPNGSGQFVPVGMIRDDEWKFHAALPGPLANAHPAGGEAGEGVGEAPRPAILEGRRRPEDDGTGDIPRCAIVWRSRFE